VGRKEDGRMADLSQAACVYWINSLGMQGLKQRCVLEFCVASIKLAWYLTDSMHLVCVRVRARARVHLCACLSIRAFELLLLQQGLCVLLISSKIFPFLI